jgi:hypothetical protein
MLKIKPLGDITLVNNQWKYKYMFCEDITLDIPLPWKVEVPAKILNFKLDFGITIETEETYMIIPHSNLGNLRMSFAPILLYPGKNRLIVQFDNYTSNKIKLYSGVDYIKIVSLKNEGILFDYNSASDS